MDMGLMWANWISTDRHHCRYGQGELNFCTARFLDLIILGHQRVVTIVNADLSLKAASVLATEGRGSYSVEVRSSAKKH